ncbi:nucleotidyltransferase domain-containing protein [Streptomyces sp. NPDC001852]|uniref:nucleotidyltransferase domain-containing protein n=1 Tax=Streptomyces sp. NPDC001852 TaxID=3364619 RepID=UPI003692A756
MDIVGLLLVGSCARNAVRPDSDVDVALLTADEAGAARPGGYRCRPPHRPPIDRPSVQGVTGCTSWAARAS